MQVRMHERAYAKVRVCTGLASPLARGCISSLRVQVFASHRACRWVVHSSLRLQVFASQGFNSGDAVPRGGRRLAHHFATHGTPIMIGGGELRFERLHRLYCGVDCGGSWIIRMH